MSGPRKLEPHQEEHLAKLEKHHDAIIAAKRDMRREIERQYQANLQEMYRTESLLMNQALQILDSRGKPIPKAAIHRAVRQGNWNTLQSMYALAADDPSLNTVESPEIPLKSYPYSRFEFRTVPALLDRPVAAKLTRFLDAKRMDAIVYFRDSEGHGKEPDSRTSPAPIHPTGWLEIEGVPGDLLRALFGTEGYYPGDDIQPRADVVEAWNEMVDALATALGQSPEIAALNHVPAEIQWDEEGRSRVNTRAYKFAQHLAQNAGIE